jgi:hypothetical protein
LRGGHQSGNQLKIVLLSYHIWWRPHRRIDKAREKKMKHYLFSDVEQHISRTI